MLYKYKVEPMDVKAIERFKAIRKRYLNRIVVALLKAHSQDNFWQLKALCK